MDLALNNQQSFICHENLKNKQTEKDKAFKTYNELFLHMLLRWEICTNGNW